MKRIFLAVVILLCLKVNAFGQTAGVTCEYWMGSALTNLADLVANPELLGAPTSSGKLTAPNFAAPSNLQGQFISRCTTQLIVTVTGYYTFWIAANKLATLWLSTSTDFTGLSYMCRVSAAFPTPSAKQWTRNAEQKSAQIRLTAGEAYYLQVVQLEDSNNINHLAVGWLLPGGVYERHIPNSRLSAVLFGYSVVNPTMAEFTPSANDDIVDYYELRFFYTGESNLLLSLDLGKPPPDVDGKIRVTYVMLPFYQPLPPEDYYARVAAVSTARGEGVSEPSNIFYIR